MQEPWSSIIKDNKVYLPKGLTDRLQWMTGKDVIPCWILTLDLGRYRILTRAQLEARPLLQELLTPPEESDTMDAQQIQSSERALLPFRIRESQVSPKSAPGWRLSLPTDLLPHGATEDGQTVYLLISQGYLEIWTPQCIAENLRKRVG
ncbi:MAG: hypothetical protein ABSE86_29300 [Bryobacteraceae bacterium]|jgi:hypothetical protein